MNMSYWSPSCKNRMLCCIATNMDGSHSNTNIKLDTDSYMIAIDNCCSYSMSNRKSDFVGQLVSFNDSIKGIGIENSIRECGRPHEKLIPGTYYNPKSPYRLLLPQHWAQKSSNPSGTTCLTTHNSMVLADTSLVFKRGFVRKQEF